MALKTEKYNKDANCYGFAVKVTNCGDASPGGVNRQEDENVATYADRLKAGVLADGPGRVYFMPEANLDNIPANARKNYYLMVMLVGESGFHFLRRERSYVFGAKRWKWKHSTLESHSYANAFHITNKVTGAGKYVDITNKNLRHFIENPDDYVQAKIAAKHPNDVVYFFEVKSKGFNSELVI